MRGLFVKLLGKAWTYGDAIDTDVIIPGRYCHITDPREVGQHAMEDLDPGFAGKLSPGDFIVAGENFGCGSSRELAPIAIKGAGIGCVVASSFARIFFRNAINIGLPILECPEAVASIEQGDELELDLAQGTITNRTRPGTFQAIAFPPFLQQLIQAGGLVNLVKDRLAQGRASLS